MLPAALLGWYQFRVNGKALYITGGDSVFEVLFDVLKEKGLTQITFDTHAQKIGYELPIAMMKELKNE